MFVAVIQRTAAKHNAELAETRLIEATAFAQDARNSRTLAVEAQRRAEENARVAEEAAVRERAARLLAERSAADERAAVARDLASRALSDTERERARRQEELADRIRAEASFTANQLSEAQRAEQSARSEVATLRTRLAQVQQEATATERRLTEFAVAAERARMIEEDTAARVRQQAEASNREIQNMRLRIADMERVIMNLQSRITNQR
jgi:hypothetical protein